jgi:phasin family protein
MSTHFADLQKSSSQFLASLQKLGQLNMDVAKASFADAAKSTQALMAAKNPQEFATLVGAELQAAPAKVSAYGTQVRDILATATKL